MSRISSFIVLAIYVLYFVHELKSRKKPDAEEAPSHQGPVENLSAAHRNRSIRFADEDAGGPKHTESIEMSATSAGSSKDEQTSSESDAEPGRRSLDSSMPAATSSRHRAAGSQTSVRSRSGSGSLRFGHGRTASRDSNHDLDHRHRLHHLSTEDLGPGGRRVLMRSALPTRHILDAESLPSVRRAGVTRFVSVLVLIVTSALMSLSAEFLVSTIDEVTHQGQLSESVIGLIILPIVGNMAEYITVVTVAVKEKLDLAIAVSVGSSIQIALCVTPLTVLAAWILQKDLVLTFSFFEMATLVGTVLLVNLVILSERAAGPRSSALRGGLICGCYAIIGYVWLILLHWT